MLALKSFWGLDRILGNTRKARWCFFGCKPVKQSNCFPDKVVASAGTTILVEPSVRVGTTPVVESEFRPKVLLRRRMANWFIKFEVIERFLRQLRLRGDVIHVVFKCVQMPYLCEFKVSRGILQSLVLLHKSPLLQICPLLT